MAIIQELLDEYGVDAQDETSCRHGIDLTKKEFEQILNELRDLKEKYKVRAVFRDFQMGLEMELPDLPAGRWFLSHERYNQWIIQCPKALNAPFKFDVREDLYFEFHFSGGWIDLYVKHITKADEDDEKTYKEYNSLHLLFINELRVDWDY